MKLLKQNYIKYGLLMSGLTALFLLFRHFTGGYSNIDEIGKSPLELLFIVFVPIAVWTLGIQAKKKEQKGKITYKQALVEGIKIALVYGITSPFVYVAYYIFLNPGMADYMRREYGMPNASFEMVILFDSVVQFIAALLGGTIYTAVLSFFLKSKSK